MKKRVIGFIVDEENRDNSAERPVVQAECTPRPSLVDVYFPHRSMSLTYYNDKFDLHKDDIVYVDGALEGFRGHVVSVNYTFKIKLSDYKRVIAVADTSVHGDYCFAGSHIVTFDPHAMPYEKVLAWFKAPDDEESEYASGNDGEGFPLDDLEKMDIRPETARRGVDYFMENRVVYISLDGSRGRAIVTGSDIYEVEFEYSEGNIYNLVCSCFCSYNCKHSFASMLQLNETLRYIADNYKDEFNGYFAAVSSAEFIKYAVMNKETGRVSFDL